MMEQNRRANKKRLNKRAMLSSWVRALNGLTVEPRQEQRTACPVWKVFHKPGFALPLLHSSDGKQKAKKWPLFSKTFHGGEPKSFKETTTKMPPDRTFENLPKHLKNVRQRNQDNGPT